MIRKHLMTTLLMLLCVLTAAAQHANRLIIPDVVTPSPSSFVVPVQLDNADEVTALQFTLSMPEGVALTTGSAALTQRATDHAAVVHAKGANTYMVMVYSPTNAPLQGRAGTLLTIEGSVSSLDDGTELPMTLSDVTLSDAGGTDITGGFEAGKVIVNSCPDLTVSEVNSSETALVPGGMVSLSWKVSNIGTQVTGGGWSERLSLITDGGSSRHIATVNYNGALAAGGSVSRTVDVRLPEVFGLDGAARLQVQLLPSAECGEPSSKQGNNTATGGEVAVTKLLTVKLSPEQVVEQNGVTVRGIVKRSGDWSAAQTFGLETADSRLTLPEQVTIEAGQSSAYFYITITANGVADYDDQAVVVATGSGYEPAQAVLSIEDDVLPDLHINATPHEINEGDALQLHISIDRALSRDLELSLVCDKASLFTFPGRVVLAAGRTATDVTVASIDDDVPYVSQTVTFAVSAPGFTGDETYVTVADNDIPEIELTLTPTTVSEGAGMQAINARLRRVGATDSKITIRLSDDSSGDIYYPQTSITLEKGVTNAEFVLGVVDNGDAEGDRTVNITAAVYISSCSCQATAADGGAVTVPVTIIDNDGPSLSLSTSLSTVLEGGSTTVTVRRNTSGGGALTVSLSSNADDALEYDRTVTIPAGESSVTVAVAVRSNSVEGDSRVIEIRAEADGYAMGTTWFMVSDQTLPDAVVRGVSVDDSELYVGDAAHVSVVLANEGAAAVPSQAVVALYVDGASAAAAELRLADALPVGGEVTLTRELSLPAVPGAHTVKAVVNPGRSFAELSYVNNDGSATVEVLPQFAVSVTADKAAYAPGETVTLSGRVTGRLIGGQTIEVYVISGGLRQTVEAVSDASGNLTATWTPASAQMGHFTAGACYPGENVSDAQTEFDVYGLSTAERYQTLQMTVGEPYTGVIKVSNKGSLEQTGITVSVLEGADNISMEFTPVASLSGGASGEIAFTLTAASPTDNSSAGLYNGWQPVKLRLVDNEGAASDYTLYCYAAMPVANLEPSVSSIKTTVPKDGTHDVEFTLHNVGRGASGVIELSLPSYITSLTPAKLPSLAFDESTTVALRFSAPEGMELSQIMKGTLGINCEGGSGVALPFEFELVSDAVGTLTVDVTDEYTYYTEEKPHVAGATVTIQHPVTSAIIAQGVTGSDGRYTVELNEGYYNVLVTEPSHDSAAATVLIDPGREKVETIVISVSGVEISYEVVETEVEDVYEVKTTFTFETNVPVPVVTVDMPTSIDGESLAIGESILFEAVITNRGLITAEDVELTLGEHQLFDFVALVQGTFDLAANQSVTIPIQMTRKAVDPQDSRKRLSEGIARCYWATDVKHRYKCDKSTNYKYVRIEIPVRVWTCSNIGKDLPEWNPPIINVPFPPIGISIPGWLQAISDLLTGGNESSNLSCEKCYMEMIIRLAKCAVNFIPGSGLGKAALDGALCLPDVWKCFKKGGTYWNGDQTTKRYCAVSATTCAAMIATDVVLKELPIVKWLIAAVDCLNSLARPCTPKKTSNTISDKRMEMANSAYEAFQEKIVYASDALDNYMKVLNEYYGDECWLNAQLSQMVEFVNVMNSFAEDGYLVPESAFDEIVASRPDNVSEQQARSFIERINNTLLVSDGYDKELYPNSIDIDLIDEAVECITADNRYAEELGYANLSDMMTKEIEKVSEALSNDSGSVCSTITLEFKQTLSLTRQAFLGTLTVKNNHESAAISDFQLHLEVRDPDGNLAGADRMEIHTKTLDGFTGELPLGSQWSLSAASTGVATVEYIPTDAAAPEKDVAYTFGGTVTFVDPYTGLTVSRELTPQTLTVRPCPQLYLDYFMQRDVLGDDPLTTDVVEPSLPAEFALLLTNRGAGDANNVKLTTCQPVITENEKGLLIDMALFNGKEAGLVMDEKYTNDFGTIAAGSHALAQWYLKSSLLGHFASYDVQVNHLTGFDNPALSLVKDAVIHELIHEGVDETNAVAFLVNDDVDANDTPDHLYGLDGMAVAVARADMTAAVAGETQLTLELTSGEAGWNYSNALDPMRGMAEVTRVVRRSDGAEVPLANVWLSDRTLRDGKDPLYENRIHLMDKITGVSEIYDVTMTPVAQPVLEVEAIDGIETTSLNMAAVTSATVRFNKAINAETFTGSDLQLRREGELLDASLIGVRALSDSEFELDLSALTAESGYYVLTVQTIDITDAEGFNGMNGKMVGWSQRVDGTVTYKVVVNPAEGGTVSPSLAGTQPYGSELTLTATAASGYEFAGWYRDDRLESSEPTAVFTLDAALTAIEARFRQSVYDVTVSADVAEGGTVVGDGSGKRNYGDELHMIAVPAQYYEFTGWTVNGEAAGGELTLDVTVSGPTAVVAHFTAIERVTIDYDLMAGWNWLSFGVADESMSDLNAALGSLYLGRELRGRDGDASRAVLWDGSLQSLDPLQSYRLRMASDGTYSFTGEPLADTTVTLTNGWNWLGYLPTDELPVAEALSLLPATAGDMLKGQDAFVLYDGEQWVGSLTEMSPGAGYMYYSRDTKSFGFPKRSMATRSRLDARAELGQPDAPWSYDPYKYADNMAVNAVVANLTLSNGAWIGAFVGDECRGAARMVDGVFYLTVHGDVEEELSLKLYDPSTGADLWAPDNKLTFNGEKTATADSPMVINAYQTGVTTPAVDGEFRLWPVPVSDVLHIDGIWHVERLVVRSVSGRQMMVLTDADVSQGVDVSHLDSGVYVLSVESGAGYRSRTFVKK